MEENKVHVGPLTAESNNCDWDSITIYVNDVILVTVDNFYATTEAGASVHVHMGDEKPIRTFHLKEEN